jgi:dethiobiotin synthetase
MSGSQRPPGLFIAGTDTGVGKTTLAVALARLARRRGGVPTPYKPVETGCDPEPSDARRLWEAARPPISLAETCPYPLPLPAAPSVAAQEAGLTLDVADLVSRGRAVGARGDFLLVEGAGGLLVPYVGAETNADLAAAFALPVVVVGRMALGTINHVALTLAELDRRGLVVAGVVLMRTTADQGPHEKSNAEQIEAVTGRRPLGPVPFLSDATDPDRVADAVERELPAVVLSRWLGR